MKSLISVIVPIYNVEPYLGKCIQSIIDQTYTNLEVILVDDGSTDSSGKICDEYAQKDARIKVIHQKNVGLAGARNAGIQIATGDFLGFIDSDDWIASNMYEVMYDSIEQTKADIAVCGRYMQFDSGELVPLFVLPKQRVFDKQEVLKRFLVSDGLDAAAWDKLYRRSFWGNMQYPLFYVSEDVPVTSQLLLKAEKVVHCGKPLYYYFQRAGSLSKSSYSEKSDGLYYFYKEAAERIENAFPYLKDECKYFYLKALLILLFRYVRGNSKAAIGKMARKQLRKNIWAICANRYLKIKYKLFALGVCLGVGKAAVYVSEWLGINETSLMR